MQRTVLSVGERRRSWEGYILEDRGEKVEELGGLREGTAHFEQLVVENDMCAQGPGYCDEFSRDLGARRPAGSLLVFIVYIERVNGACHREVEVG